MNQTIFYFPSPSFNRIHRKVAPYNNAIVRPSPVQQIVEKNYVWKTGGGKTHTEKNNPPIYQSNAIFNMHTLDTCKSSYFVVKIYHEGVCLSKYFQID